MQEPKDKYKDQITATFTEEQWNILKRDVPEFVEKHYKESE